MPTYSYQCQSCGHEYDALQSIKSEPDTVCPKCQGRVERLIGAGAGIVFKGSGFYVTDYKKTSSPKSEGSSAPSTASSSTQPSSTPSTPAPSTPSAPSSSTPSSGSSS
ncbi:MAG: zinc ribbon domain-containing protein [Spirochaetia bacterium]|nr:zinc ribbon domain-containing protein [Spirochaetia bacterium]